MKRHAGEISFPGGKVESGETPLQTALREFCEELNVCEGVKLIGRLPATYTFKTNFTVIPFIVSIESLKGIKTNFEVERVIIVSIDELKKLERCIIPGIYYIYPLSKGVIWGATARIVSKFIRSFKI